MSSPTDPPEEAVWFKIQWLPTAEAEGKDLTTRRADWRTLINPDNPDHVTESKWFKLPPLDEEQGDDQEAPSRGHGDPIEGTWEVEDALSHLEEPAVCRTIFTADERRKRLAVSDFYLWDPQTAQVIVDDQIGKPPPKPATPFGNIFPAPPVGVGAATPDGGASSRKSTAAKGPLGRMAAAGSLSDVGGVKMDPVPMMDTRLAEFTGVYALVQRQSDAMQQRHTELVLAHQQQTTQLMMGMLSFMSSMVERADKASAAPEAIGDQLRTMEERMREEMRSALDDDGPAEPAIDPALLEQLKELATKPAAEGEKPPLVAFLSTPAGAKIMESLIGAFFAKVGGAPPGGDQ